MFKKIILLFLFYPVFCFAGGYTVTHVGGASSINLLDDIDLSFGTGSPAKCRWTTSDSNANYLICTFPEGGVVDVPGFGVGDATVYGTDNGFFNGSTDPFIFAISDDGTKFVKISHDGTNAILSTNSGLFSISGGISTSAKIINSPQSITASSDGTGASATLTITPTSSDVRVTCNDSDGCLATLSETGAVDGQILKVFCVSSNNVTFSDTSGVTELAASFVCGQYDNISMTYLSDRWVEIGRTDN